MNSTVALRATATQRVPRRHVDGVLLLDKPRGLSSNAALQRVKRWYRAEKAGHTGTLDPLATGLLPVCFGEATKFAHLLLDADKRYLATLRLGVTTTTGDAEGEVVATRPVTASREAVEEILPRFVGRIAQVPPRYSALKRDGRTYYEYARKGVDLPRIAREVVIRSIGLLSWRAPEVELAVHCGKGTYMRALAEDIGEALGCGAHLAALSRTAVGEFTLAWALTLDALEERSEPERDAALLPVDTLVVRLDRLDLARAEATCLVQGRPLIRGDVGDGLVRVYAAGAFAGVADVRGGVVRARRMMAQLQRRATPA
ncbi:MAG TPA: tRNA pseudouridine(55) synthase TruB [Casimicrobiaceae bacterium]